MQRVIYIGMDVHSTTFSVCALELMDGIETGFFAETKMNADPKNVIRYPDELKTRLGTPVTFITGYEAGCPGFSLHNELKKAFIECRIPAPTTMPVAKGGKRVRTDSRDAGDIAQCLAFNSCSFVHVPTVEDIAVRDYIRMRSDHKEMLKSIKQRICALALRHGIIYRATKWTAAHLKLLRETELPAPVRESLNEYLATYVLLSAKIKAFDTRIEELSRKPAYDTPVSRLACFCGISGERATAIMAEVSDFFRFAKPQHFAAFPGLVPGEQSGGEGIHRTSLTKAGNCHLRKEFIEAAQSICRGMVGYKSKAPAARQKGNPPEAIACADKANERLRRWYYKMVHNGKNRNVAVAAVARGLCCFVCGMIKDYTPAAGARQTGEILSGSEVFRPHEGDFKRPLRGRRFGSSAI